MSGPAAIEIDRLVKRYPRSGRTPARRLLGDLGRAALGLAPRPHAGADEFAAVDGLSLQVDKGEAVALIGRNGCGKTTTLRVVAGLLRPDAGAVRVRGRVQALIALGAGFNDRLSGLENIRNNAAVLGLGARQTRGIVDAVVDFAEIPGFIRSPVGTYSSGMKARLGFAVAVHLEPEVLLIDEILGVGDFAFQNKCFARMNAMLREGVTLLLVSHSHNKVVQMCQRAAWLERGRLRGLGPAKEVVRAYLDDASPAGPADWKPASAGLFGPEHPADPAVSGLFFEAPAEVPLLAPAAWRYGFNLGREVTGLNVTLNVYRSDGTLLWVVSTLNGDLLAAPRSGPVRVSVDLPSVNLVPGRYTVGMSVHEGHGYLFRGVVGGFTVLGGDKLTWAIADPDARVTVQTPPG